MNKIVDILVFVFLLNNLNSQALLIDSKHGFIFSSELFIDTENVIDDQTNDYKKETSVLPSFDFSYIYKKNLEFNLNYKSNTLEIEDFIVLSDNNAFHIPSKGNFYNLKVKYYIKNIIKKISKSISEDGESWPDSKFDFNINFNIEFGKGDFDYSYNAYGLGFSWHMKNQTLISEYNIYPMINYFICSSEITQTNISYNYNILKLEMLTNINISPKDNKEVKVGFFINPSISSVDLNDSFFGLQLGAYYKL